MGPRRRETTEIRLVFTLVICTFSSSSLYRIEEPIFWISQKKTTSEVVYELKIIEIVKYCQFRAPNSCKSNHFSLHFLRKIGNIIWVTKFAHGSLQKFS